MSYGTPLRVKAETGDTPRTGGPPQGYGGADDREIASSRVSGTRCKCVKSTPRYRESRPCSNRSLCRAPGKCRLTARRTPTLAGPSGSFPRPPRRRRARDRCRDRQAVRDLCELAERCAMGSIGSTEPMWQSILECHVRRLAAIRSARSPGVRDAERVRLESRGDEGACRRRRQDSRANHGAGRPELTPTGPIRASRFPIRR